jgi:thiamine transporter ThiT
VIYLFLVIQKNNAEQKFFFIFINLFLRYYEGVVFSEEITAPFLYGKDTSMKSKKLVLNVSLSGMFLALAYVMPFLTGQIPEIGSMLCPMHIPVLLCGFVCGAPYGLVVGLVAPVLRSLTLGMPPLFPTATAMAFELAVYGLMAGLLYKALPKKKINIYTSLIGAMIIGRIVWGVVMFCIMGFDMTKFGIAAFWAGAVVNAIPGIIAQIILIPMFIMVLEKAKLMPNKKQ